MSNNKVTNRRQKTTPKGRGKQDNVETGKGHKRRELSKLEKAAYSNPLSRRFIEKLDVLLALKDEDS